MEGVRRGTYVRLPVRRLGLVPNTRTVLNQSTPLQEVLIGRTGKVTGQWKEFGGAGKCDSGSEDKHHRGKDASAKPELSIGLFFVTRSKPTHQLTDPTQPNQLQVGKFGPNPTQPNTANNRA